MFKNIRFIGFDKDTTACGAKQHAIYTNGIHPNYHPKANFAQIRFINTHSDAMVGLQPPNPGWLGIDGCGAELTCTGLYNLLLEMK